MRKRRRVTGSVPTVCPTCGSRVGAATRRCLVCGADLNRPGPDPARGGPARGVVFARALVPFVAVSCLAAFGLLFIFGAAGAVPLPALEFLAEDPTNTPTPTETFTPSPTAPPTMTPPPTPLPPLEHVIVPGDSILQIAIDYDVAPWAINELNNLAPDAVLSVGQVLLIPIPTAVPPATPTPTETLMP